MFRKKTITKIFFALKLSTIHWLPYCILWQKEIVSDAVSQNSYIYVQTITHLCKLSLLTEKVYTTG